jgi:hypothetical protein
MTSRERNLAAFLLVLLILGGVALTGKLLFFDPYFNLRKQTTDKDRQIDQLQRDLGKEHDYVAEITRLSPRLAQWKKMSLPAVKEEPKKKDDPRQADRKKLGEAAPSAEAARSHLDQVRVEYQQFLQKLLDGAKFHLTDFKPPDPRAASASGSGNAAGARKPPFQVLAYKVEGECNLQGIVKFFEELYRTPLLHQVKEFSITQQRSAADPNNLLVKMTVEVLLVEEAERLHATVTRDDKKVDVRPNIFPEFDSKPPDVLPSGKKKRDYQLITTRNPFVPVREKVVTERPVAETKENPDQVLPAVRLTMISYSDYYGAWVAQVQNQGNKKENTALLTDEPLPKGTRYQSDREAALKAKSALPTEPLRRWVIKDKYQETVEELRIARIEPLRVVFADEEGKLYGFDIGTYLDEALKAPLDEATLEFLEQSSDRDAVCKQVELKKLEFRKERDAYEGQFVNGERWDEKEILSTGALEGDLSTPNDWKVRDRFGYTRLQMVVVKMDKERVIFKVGEEHDANKPGGKVVEKHYAIKPGGNLADALKKPLTDAEVKALALKGP